MGSCVLELTNATFPAVADIPIEPTTFAVGSALPTAPPVASCTSRYLPGCSIPKAARLVTVQVEPVFDAYCTDQLDTSTGVVPRLKISMKSFVKVAVALPPPP